MNRLGHLAFLVLLVGLVMTGIAAGKLEEEFPFEASTTVLLYLVGSCASLVGLAQRRGLGLFLSGAFAVNCGMGALSSLGLLLLHGHDGLVEAALGLLLGAVGTCLVCLPCAWILETPDGQGEPVRTTVEPPTSRPGDSDVRMLSRG